MGVDRRTGYLMELEHELDTRGLVARVVRTRSGPSFLRVVNPDAASLAEDVTCAPGPGTSDHYFWWSWGERLHRVDDPRGAASKLANVLRPSRVCGEAFRTAMPVGVPPPETAVESPAGRP